MLKLKDYCQLDIVAAFATWLIIAGTTLWTWQQHHGVDDAFIIGTVLFVVFWLGFSSVASDRSTNKTLGHKQHVLLAVMFSAICGLYFTLPPNTIAILGVIWAAVLAYLNSRFIAYALIPIGMIPYYLSRVYFWEFDHVTINFLLNMMFQFFSLMTFERMRYAENAELKTQQLNRELLATQALVKAMGEQSERLRISRDLHDTLGHHLTALTLNLQVASHLAEGEAKEKVDQSFAIAKLLLSDVRETVSHLRDEAQINIHDAIQQLIAGIDAPTMQLVMDETVEIRDAQVAETVFRCVQEALTNVIRHSQATACQVMLTETPQHWLLRIQDNGKIHTGSIHAGNGLTGMKERVQSVNGQINWEAGESGFVISVAIQKESE